MGIFLFCVMMVATFLAIYIINEREEEMEKNKVLEIAIKYFDERFTIERITCGDWIDLKTREDIELEMLDYREIPLGVAMKLPDGYEAWIVPRSSTFKKYHIIQTNGIGIIDNSYCGDNDEWKMPVLAMRDTFIPKGTRICQFRVIKSMKYPRLKEVTILDTESRGGFGSTGD